MLGIGVGINRNRFAQGGAVPAFSGTQWQLLTVQNWENITTNWN